MSQQAAVVQAGAHPVRAVPTMVDQLLIVSNKANLLFALKSAFFKAKNGGQGGFS